MGNYKSITFGIPVSNLEASQKWITSVFGQLETMIPDEGMLEFLLLENVWLQIFEGDSANNSSVVRLEIDNASATYERLKNLGVKVGEMISVPSVVEVFDFQDNDGNTFSFYQLL